MTKRSTWKQSERSTAEIIGGQRVPVTGRHSGDVPDIEHPVFAIEHKNGKRVISSTLKKALSQASKAAETNRKIPLVTMEQAEGSGHKNHRLVLMDIEDFKKVLKGYEWLKVEIGILNNAKGGKK